MTVTLVDVLLLILTASVVVAVVFVVRLALQLTRTTAEAEAMIRHINYLRPQIENILKEAEGELSDLRDVTQKVDDIAGNVGAITHQTTKLALPLLTNASVLAKPLRYAGAALAGAKIGLQVLGSRKKKKKDEDD
jgi:predicted PurR-regulated permease PerM